MHPLAETLLDEPVIAAVKTDDALTAALASPCSTVFLLASTLLNVGELVRRIHAAGKLAVVHIDLVDGLSAREVAVNSLIALCHPDGIISTHPSLIRRARHQGLLTIQRASCFFLPFYKFLLHRHQKIIQFTLNFISAWNCTNHGIFYDLARFHHITNCNALNPFTPI